MTRHGNSRMARLFDAERWQHESFKMQAAIVWPAKSYPNVSLAKSTAKDSPPAAKLRADTLNLPRLALIGATGRALVNAAGALCTQFFMVNAILRRQARQVGYQF